MIYTESEKQAALAWADSHVSKRELLIASGHPDSAADPIPDYGDIDAARTLAAAVRSRDEEIARLRGFHEACELFRLKPDGNHDRCNAGLRSQLKTAEEEIAGLRKVLEGTRCGWYPNTDLCRIPGQTCRRCEVLAATKTGRKL